MKTVDINLPNYSYQVRIGRGVMTLANELIPYVVGRQVCIVTDEIVGKLYLDKVQKAMTGKQIIVKIIVPGETSKTLSVAESIVDFLLKNHCDRDVTIIALGGGVVGDIAGFVAACYLRGVNYIQIPTTLLAQVDSSVGGKTAVNHPRGKNMIGAFHQPRRVLIDINALDTLDARQFSAGLAEVIKYGLINNADFFNFIEDNIAHIIAQQSDAMETIIANSCTIKGKIVGQDERESGVRALLNFGHTFAHAIETGGDYTQILHGEAVGIGMSMAAYMSVQTGRISTMDKTRIDKLLTAAGLQVSKTNIAANTMLKLMQVDKKVRDGKIRLILLKSIGRAEIVDDYDSDMLSQTINHYAK